MKPTLALLVMISVSALADMPIPSTNLVPNWRTVVGVPGGIPRWSQGASGSGLDNTGATDVTAGLNALISGLQNQKQAVVLPAGVYKATGTIHMQNYTVLRGVGTNTILECYNPIVFDSVGLGITTLNLASACARGDTSVTFVSPPTALGSGCVLLINELNDGTNVTINGWEDQCGPHPCTYCDGTVNNGTRVRGQYVIVTNVSGSTVSFTPPLFSAFNTTLTARGEWYQTNASTNNTAAWSGIEDLSIDNADWKNANNVVQFGFNSPAVYSCWASNVNVLFRGDGETAAFLFQNAVNCEVRHCYFVGGSQDAWAVYLFVNNGNVLTEDNIMRNCKIAWGISGLAAGNYAFGNLSIIKTNPSTAVLNDMVFHGGCPDYNGIEANFFVKLDLDEIHGNSMRTAIFRNWAHERLTNSTSQAYAIQIDLMHHYAYPVGNILGFSGMKTNDLGAGWTYEAIGDNSGQSQATNGCPLSGITSALHDFVYSLSGNNQRTNDSYIKASAIRDMNFSWVSNAIEHASSGGATNLDKSILYPNGPPAYWGNLAWPAFEPTTAAAYTVDPQSTNSLPAALRYWLGVDPSSGGGGGGGGTNVVIVSGGFTLQGPAKLYSQ